MSDNINEGSKDYLELYKQYTANLRSWFVIYGVGGIVLFASNTETFGNSSRCTKARIASAFLVAVLVQVIVACINKYINLYLAFGEENPKYKEHKFYKIADKTSNHVWIDVVADVFSILLFSWAAIELIIIFSITL